MKKIAYIILIGCILGFLSCKKLDSLYEEYIVPNGVYYPAKAVNVEAHPGKKRIEIAWKNGADPKVVKARISWNNDTQGIDIDVKPGMDAISRIIDNLEEDTYSFLIRTYDANNNASVPVEVNGKVYGELYERSLVPRSVKNSLYNMAEGIYNVEWNEADATEAGMELYYTDVNNNRKTLQIDRSKTALTIDDLKAGEPVSYTTLYKPDSLAIDLFRTPNVRIPYYADITAQTLKNTEAPFTYHGASTDFVNNIIFVYAIDDWIYRQEDGAVGNGNVIVDGADQLLIFLVFNGQFGLFSPSRTIKNGKLYQTVELEAGAYKFKVYTKSAARGPSDISIAAALGDNLPDTGNLEQALAFTRRNVPDGSTDVISIEFTISQKSSVSLGFVVNLVNGNVINFSKVELLKQF